MRIPPCRLAANLPRRGQGRRRGPRLGQPGSRLSVSRRLRREPSGRPPAGRGRPLSGRLNSGPGVGERGLEGSSTSKEKEASSASGVRRRMGVSSARLSLYSTADNPLRSGKSLFPGWLRRRFPSWPPLPHPPPLLRPPQLQGRKKRAKASVGERPPLALAAERRSRRPGVTATQPTPSACKRNLPLQETSTKRTPTPSKKTGPGYPLAGKGATRLPARGPKFAVSTELRECKPF